MRTAFSAWVCVTLVILLAIKVLAGPSVTFTGTAQPSFTASAFNCPTSPPAQAAAAGFTRLLFCLDGADPHNATLSNWVDCSGGYASASLPPYLTQYGGISTCDTNHFAQVTDPLTGATVLRYHQNHANDGNGYEILATRAYGFANSAFIWTFPAQNYMEAKIRLGSDTFTASLSVEDIFHWSFDGDTMPTNGNNCATQVPDYCPHEIDVFEAGNPGGENWNQGEIDWSACFCGYSQGNYQYERQVVPNFTLTDPHTYGQLITGDAGNSNPQVGNHTQVCAYVDGNFHQIAEVPYTGNCVIRTNYPANKTWSGRDESHKNYANRSIEIDFGGADSDTDQYIFYIAIWSCPAATIVPISTPGYTGSLAGYCNLGLYPSGQTNFIYNDKPERPFGLPTGHNYTGGPRPNRRDAGPSYAMNEHPR